MILKKMHLKNFMCYEDKEIDFSERTLICGANGRGKSSIASAYTWVMFDCDYNLKSSPAVRREVDGEPNMDSDVEVSLTFDMDGKEVTMAKVQKRKYSKDGETYKDDNKYFINDVAKTKKEFDAYLDIDAKVLKACSNIDWFISQKPEEMRAYLFGLIKDVSDIDVCKTSPDLSDLEAKLEKYTAEELDAMSKKKLADANKEFPVLKGQIKEKDNDIKMRSEFDLAALELQKNALKEQLAENLKKQTDTQQILNEYDSATNGIMELKFKLSDMENKANDALFDERKALGRQLVEAEGEIKHISTLIAMNTSSAGNIKLRIMSLNNEKGTAANLWKQEKQREFDGNSTCPYCGRELEKEEQERLKADFMATKEANLKKIEANGMALKKEIEENTAKLNEIEESTAKLNEKLETLTAKRDAVSEKRKNLPGCVDISDSEDYKEIMRQIQEKEKCMEKFQNVADMKTQLKQEENDLNEQMRSVERRIDWGDTQAEEERLEELIARRIDLEQGKADAERILYLLDELKKAKNDIFSYEINRHFNMVKWKLFDYAKNGNYKSVCVPMMDEKSILSTISNKGNRIIGKVDICRSIQKIEGVSVPIWLDDSESLDAENRKKVSEMVDGQLIMLIVNDSDKLRVESEG